MVVDVPAPPSRILGVIDDMWLRWVTTSACPAPIAARAAVSCSSPPGYDGPLPDSGFHVGHVAHDRAHS